MAKSGMKTSTLRMAQLAILIAIEAVLVFTPIGMIMIPPISITTMHLPVIIAAILLGPSAGGITGAAFGILAMIRASMTGNPGDMLFSPFVSGNPVGSIIMCIIPRILLGIFTAYLFILMKKAIKKDLAAIPIAAAIGTILHTIMVLGCIWLFFRAFPLKTVFTAIISINGGLEIIMAVIVSTAVCKPLLNTMKKHITAK